MAIYVGLIYYKEVFGIGGGAVSRPGGRNDIRVRRPLLRGPLRAGQRL